MFSEIQFGDYQILILKGSSKQLLLSLSGVGNVSSNQMSFEFKSSLEKLELSCHKIFIKDLSRSWFNSKNGWLDLVGFLKNYISEFEIKDTRMLGLSMGGFGAIVLSKYIDATKVLVFSTRESISKGNTFDERNSSLIEKIKDIPHNSINEMMSHKTEYTLVFSIDDLMDALHASFFDQEKCNLYYCRGDHNIPNTLKKTNLSLKLISSFLDDTFCPKDYFFHKPVSTIFSLAWRFFEKNDILNRNLKSIPLRFFPKFMMSILAKDLNQRGITAYPTHSFSTISVINRELLNFLGKGWANLEKWGSWGIGNQHWIKIFITDLSVYKKIRIDIRLRVFSGLEMPLQRVVVKNNNNVVASIVTAQKEKEIVLSVVTSNYSNNIVIVTPDAVSPFALGLSGDKRKLSIGIKEIKILPEIL